MIGRAPEAAGPHRRFNPLLGEWVLVSAQRTDRPWQGSTELTAPDDPGPRHDPSCYLCPGNQRAGTAVNPNYSYTHVFTNDFPALLPDEPTVPAARSPLFQAEAAAGTCRVLCFSPNHGLTLAEFEAVAIRSVIDLWAEQTAELGSTYRWVQVFENKGEMMGASNPHPHGQIWAGNALPTYPAAEDRHQFSYRTEHGTNLLEDYAGAEAVDGTRVVVENDEWLAVVPYWATWPFETMLLPRRRVARLPDLSGDERAGLAALLKRLLTRYDNLFTRPFPYSMGWHGAPFDDADTEHWQLHAHIYPPLLRSASVRKFMVGYELLGESQRDLSPEQAAFRLRDQSDTHYRAGRRSPVI
jgi:UDPglucose--hexose-1-phosphate uridylyltransferase